MSDLKNSDYSPPPPFPSFKIRNSAVSVNEPGNHNFNTERAKEFVGL